ncbi:MAG: RluA family pseudouridine synthase [Deltaproteobacteria bacterium]|jgi:23S rRNA pseudouridine1911/1915/1917 synthase|nr:RluA family pseudouridine synthase [Deltaproteobacteria bacterium]
MSGQGPFSFTVQHSEHDQRVDVVVSTRLEECSRSFAATLIHNDFIRVNRAAVKPSHRLKTGDVVEGEIPPPKPVDCAPEPISLDFLYQDSALAVVNKPAGMVVHPAPGNYTGTLVNALLFHCPDLSGIGGDIRPGIVHRLDKGTSGVMVIAKNGSALDALVRQFKERSVRKTYLAVVHGNVKADSGEMRLPIGRHPTQRKKMSTSSRAGRPAETYWRVVERFGGFTLLRLDLKTGRTHQIRVHCAAMHHPVVGDPDYGGRHASRISADASTGVRHLVQNVERQMLHAHKLQIIHPVTGERMRFTAPVPADMQALMDGLRPG